VTLGLAAIVRMTAAAEEEDKGPLSSYTMETAVTGGYRTVDIDGSKARYREDYNLRSGGRLFNFAIKGSSSAPDSTAVDRFRLEVDTPGDEPVSHFRLTAADRKLFDLRARFTRSKYEYAVPQLFEAPVSGNVRTDDLHDFDIVRTNGAVDLTVRPPNLPTLHFGYRLYHRDADSSSISTVRISGGDTFLVRAPFDSTTNVGQVGTTFRAFDTDVFLQQEYRRVDRHPDLRDVLNPAGLDPTDGSRLSFYRNDQDEHIDIPATTVRLRRSIGDAIDLSAAYFFSYADLSFDRDRRRTGTDSTGAAAGDQNVSGDGDANLTTNIVDIAASVRVSDRVRVHTTYRYNDRSQDGSLDELSGFGVLDSDTDDDVRINSVSGEVEVEPRPNLLLRGGVRYSHRDADLSFVSENVTTDTVGTIGSVRYRPWSFVNVFARYENVQIDDPYVVPGEPTSVPPLPDRETALTFVNRGSAGFRLKPLDWMEIRYQMNADSRENDDFGARAWVFGNSVTLALSPIKGLTALASYTYRDLDRRADIFVAPLYERTTSVQEGSENVFVSVLRYDFALFGQQWSSGWNVSYVDSDSTYRPRLESGGGRRTSFDLDRVDGGAFLTLYHRFLEPTIEFRMVDYNQSPLTRNDYRATMVVLKATRRFSF
jgi:hypothetical protein